MTTPSEPASKPEEPSQSNDRDSVLRDFIETVSYDGEPDNRTLEELPDGDESDE